MSTQTDDSPKMPALTDCENPLHPARTNKVYCREQQKRYKKNQRKILLIFKMTIRTKWLESYLDNFCHEKTNGDTYMFEEINDEKLFGITQCGAGKRT